jgi:hypothetical protein
MKTSVSELIGPALDLAVAMAEGMSWWTRSNAKWDTNDGYTDWILDKDGVLKRFYFDGSCSRAGHWEVIETFKPSTDGNRGVLIIEREGISVIQYPDPEWGAQRWGKNDNVYGPTFLITAMRCFVASKLGKTVDIPFTVEDTLKEKNT